MLLVYESVLCDESYVKLDTLTTVKSYTVIFIFDLFESNNFNNVSYKLKSFNNILITHWFVFFHLIEKPICHYKL